MDQFAALKQLRESACHHRTGPHAVDHHPDHLISGSSNNAGLSGLTVSALRPFSNSHRYPSELGRLFVKHKPQRPHCDAKLIVAPTSLPRRALHSTPASNLFHPADPNSHQNSHRSKTKKATFRVASATH